jgi:hypothetical protein
MRRRERDFQTLAANQKTDSTCTPVELTLDAPLPSDGDDRDLWAEMREAEIAAAERLQEEAAATAARRAWCDEFELQPELRRNPRPAAQVPPSTSPVAGAGETQPLSDALKTTLRDLLDLHECGEAVSWPSGFDARTARQRLYPNG